MPVSPSQRVALGTVIFLLVAEMLLAGILAERRGLLMLTYDRILDIQTYLHEIGGDYPPGPAIIYFLARKLWDSGPHMWNSLLGLVAFGGLAALFRVVSPVQSLKGAVFIGFLTVMNLYGVWLMVTADDTALDNLFMFWAAWAVWKHVTAARFDWRWLVASCLLVGLSSFMRVSSFLIWISFLTAWILIQRSKRPIPILAWVVVLAVGYSGLNLERHGSFTLTTTSPMNLYLAQHPRYLDVHPQHDIEALNPSFERERERILKEHPNASESEIGRELVRRVVGSVRENPGGALARTALKGIWYFLGVTKIPIFTESDLAVINEDGSVTVGERKILMTVAYLPYGVCFLLLFWFSLIHYVRGRNQMVLLYVPFLIMGLVGMVYFPDTRFRQSAELLTYVPISVYVLSVVIPFSRRVLDRVPGIRQAFSRS